MQFYGHLMEFQMIMKCIFQSKKIVNLYYLVQIVCYSVCIASINTGSPMSSLHPEGPWLILQVDLKHYIRPQGCLCSWMQADKVLIKELSYWAENQQIVLWVSHCIYAQWPAESSGSSLLLMDTSRFRCFLAWVALGQKLLHQLWLTWLQTQLLARWFSIGNWPTHL